jgi:hypothetical protein
LDEEARDDKTPIVDEAIAPDFIFTIDMPDALIKQRIMKLPESAVAGTKFTEECISID